MSKPKLTEEQLEEIFDIANDCLYPNYIKIMIDKGYADKPETKLEKAERLRIFWTDCTFENDDSFEERTRQYIDTLWEAIEELKEKIK